MAGDKTAFADVVATVRASLAGLISSLLEEARLKYFLQPPGALAPI